MNLGKAEIKQRARKYEKEDAERKTSFLLSPIDARIWGRERVTAKNKENFYICFSGENYIWAFECADPLDPETSHHRTCCIYKMDPLAWHLKNLIENDSKKSFIYLFSILLAMNDFALHTWLGKQPLKNWKILSQDTVKRNRKVSTVRLASKEGEFKIISFTLGRGLHGNGWRKGWRERGNETPEGRNNHFSRIHYDSSSV